MKPTLKKRLLINNKLSDIQIIIIPSCPVYDLWIQVDTEKKASMRFFGGAYTSSDLHKPLFITEGMGASGHYDCWDFNFDTLGDYE